MKIFLPILQWLPKYRKEMLFGDAISGITAGILAITQGMAYAMIAGLPPVFGLYAAMTPQIIYVLLGTSRQLSIGPVAMDSLIVAAGISAIGIVGIEEYILAAVFLAFFVGIIQVILGVLKLGFLANFLSKPVLNGFTSAAALIIGLSQLKHMLRVDMQQTNKIHILFQEVILNFSETHFLSLGLGLVGIILIKVFQKINKKIPAILIVVSLGTIVMYFTQWHLQGIKIVGEIPVGLPKIGMPKLDKQLIIDLFPVAITLAVVGFTEAISIAKAIEEKHTEYQVDPNQELIAVGSGNIIGSFVQSYPTTASFSRSAIQDQGGAKSGIASLFSAALVLLTLLFLTPLFYYLPIPILAAIIMVSIFGLINIKYPIQLWKKNRDECLAFLITFIITMTVGIPQGIVIGILLSLLTMIFRTSKPHIAILGKIKNTEYYKNVNRFEEDITVDKRILIFRFDAQLFFGNQDYFKKELLKQVEIKGAELELIIINAEAINYIDSSALNMLEKVCTDLKETKIKIMITGAIGPIRDIIFNHKLITIIGADNLFINTSEAVNTFSERNIVSGIQRKISTQNLTVTNVTKNNTNES
ncbi:SulP family inorganic anion transporter [Candidatus Arcticimaribacter forsetii]|uniref:SulP family inorganic anion transporter n=1 Tax=Candidatus Arcticimaribacter forsetii TaxID=2820661 RepID=UPI0020771055|nr:sulfate permease [Candidatus Arcticimaribacter forsetii]MDB2329849.1 sulfate permease [Flavobacteriaceae bacterium]MDB4738314.1 sulfate permease [Flavobacteriaceae bacterium]